MKLFQRLVWSIALVSVLAVALPARSCPFCDGEKGPTLVGQFEEAQIVLYGHFENARLSKPTGWIKRARADFVIEEVLKSHDMIKGKKKITLPRPCPRFEDEIHRLLRCL